MSELRIGDDLNKELHKLAELLIWVSKLPDIDGEFKSKNIFDMVETYSVLKTGDKLFKSSMDILNKELKSYIEKNGSYPVTSSEDKENTKVVFLSDREVSKFKLTLQNRMKSVIDESKVESTLIGLVNNGKMSSLEFQKCYKQKLDIDYISKRYSNIVAENTEQVLKDKALFVDYIGEGL